MARGEKKFEFPVSWGIDLQVGAGAAAPAGGGRPARVSVRASPAAPGTKAGRPAVRPARAASNPSRCPPVPPSEHERCPTQEAFNHSALRCTSPTASCTRAAERARAVPDGGGVQGADHRVQLPQGHQGGRLGAVAAWVWGPDAHRWARPRARSPKDIRVGRWLAQHSTRGAPRRRPPPRPATHPPPPDHALAPHARLPPSQPLPTTATTTNSHRPFTCA